MARLGTRIRTRHGRTKPTTSNLEDYELGWDTKRKALYIKDGVSNTIVPTNKNFGEYMSFEEISIAANGSTTISFEASLKKFIVLSSVGTNTNYARDAIIVNSNSTGTIGYTLLSSPTSISYTTGSGTFTITNSSDYSIRGFAISF